MKLYYTKIGFIILILLSVVSISVLLLSDKVSNTLLYTVLRYTYFTVFLSLLFLIVKFPPSSKDRSTLFTILLLTCPCFTQISSDIPARGAEYSAHIPGNGDDIYSLILPAIATFFNWRGVYSGTYGILTGMNVLLDITLIMSVFSFLKKGEHNIQLEAVTEKINVSFKFISVTVFLIGAYFYRLKIAPIPNTIVSRADFDYHGATENTYLLCYYLLYISLLILITRKSFPSKRYMIFIFWLLAPIVSLSNSCHVPETAYPITDPAFYFRYSTIKPLFLSVFDYIPILYNNACGCNTSFWINASKCIKDNFLWTGFTFFDEKGLKISEFETSLYSIFQYIFLYISLFASVNGVKSPSKISEEG